jgi:hypothetical protein
MGVQVYIFPPHNTLMGNATHPQKQGHIPSFKISDSELQTILKALSGPGRVFCIPSCETKLKGLGVSHSDLEKYLHESAFFRAPPSLTHEGVLFFAISRSNGWQGFAFEVETRTTRTRLPYDDIKTETHYLKVVWPFRPHPEYIDAYPEERDRQERIRQLKPLP